MVVITVILVGVAVILLIATSLRYTRFGQKLCFHATGRRHHLETSTENASQLAARADVQDPVRTQDPRMSPYSLIPPSLLPPLPTYDDVSSDVPPPAFEEAHDSPPNTENMTMTSIIPLPQPAIIHDPECTPAPQRPPPAYTSFSSPPTSGPPAEQRESQRQR
ncbi:unnamed protein product [Schistocephalus solidus]|uniref:Secreted protein n=4 Tax=Schistocephalus solidus TaxID=70667 RepID=A0A183SRI1_SCHSO|nr:unnamed protein product [Schistocephalus solidus]